MRRTRPVVITLALLLAVVAAIAAPRAQTSATYEPLRLYLEAVSLVHERYVDPVSWDRLAHLGVRGLIAGLDADSEVLTPQEYRELTESTSHPGAEIGVVLTRRDHTLTVMTPIDGMPAAQAGLQPGDQVLEIDGADTSDRLPVDASERLRGTPGTNVVVSIQRKGWAEPRPYTVTRAQVPAGTVSGRDLGNRVFYARIRELDGSTFQELSRALATPAAREARGLGRTRGRRGRRRPCSAP